MYDYDRSTRMSMGTLYSYASSVAEEECPLVIDDWATREGMLQALREHADQWREYQASATRRGDTKGAAEDEAYAVKFEAAIAKLEAEAEASHG